MPATSEKRHATHETVSSCSKFPHTWYAVCTAAAVCTLFPSFCKPIPNVGKGSISKRPVLSRLSVYLLCVWDAWQNAESSSAPAYASNLATWPASSPEGCQLLVFRLAQSRAVGCKPRACAIGRKSSRNRRHYIQHDIPCRPFARAAEGSLAWFGAKRKCLAGAANSLMFKSDQRPLQKAERSLDAKQNRACVACFLWPSSSPLVTTGAHTPRPISTSPTYLRLEEAPAPAGVTAIEALLAGVKIHASVVTGATQKASPKSPKLDIFARLP